MTSARTAWRQMAADSSGHIAVSSVFMTGRLDGNITVRLLGDEGDTSCGNTSFAVRQFLILIRNGKRIFPSRTPLRVVDPVQSNLKLMRHDPISLATVGVPDALASLANELAAAESTRETLAVMSVDSLADLPGFESRTGLRGFSVSD